MKRKFFTENKLILEQLEEQPFNCSDNILEKNEMIPWVKDSLNQLSQKVLSPSECASKLEEIENVNWSKKNKMPNNSPIYVYALQQGLCYLGYGGQVGKIDGLFGANTRNAVIAFQDKWNKDHPESTIATDGWPGKNTTPKIVQTLRSLESTEASAIKIEEIEANIKASLPDTLKLTHYSGDETGFSGIIKYRNYELYISGHPSDINTLTVKYEVDSKIREFEIERQSLSDKFDFKSILKSLDHISANPADELDKFKELFKDPESIKLDKFGLIESGFLKPKEQQNWNPVIEKLQNEDDKNALRAIMETVYAIEIKNGRIFYVNIFNNCSVTAEQLQNFSELTHLNGGGLNIDNLSVLQKLTHIGLYKKDKEGGGTIASWYELGNKKEGWTYQKSFLIKKEYAAGKTTPLTEIVCLTQDSIKEGIRATVDKFEPSDGAKKITITENQLLEIEGLTKNVVVTLDIAGRKCTFNLIYNASNWPSASPARQETTKIQTPNLQAHQQILNDNFDITQVNLTELTTLPLNVAKKLIERLNKTDLRELKLTNVKNINEAVAKVLIEFYGASLCLDALEDIDLKTIQTLANFAGSKLTLNGIKKIEEPMAQALAKAKTSNLHLNGLTNTTSDDALIALTKYKNRLHIPDSIRERMNDLLHKQILADDFDITKFNFKQLTTLTPNVTKQLVKKANEASCNLYLSRVTSIDETIARELAEFKGDNLDLNGLKQINIKIAKILAGIKVDKLYLGGLKKITIKEAEALAKFNGSILHLGGDYEVRDKHILMALAKYKGELSFHHFRLIWVMNKVLHDRIKADDFDINEFNLENLRSLTTKTATIIVQKANEAGLDELRFPEITSFDSNRTSVVKILPRFTGNTLVLSGLSIVNDQEIRELAQYKGNLVVPGEIKARIDAFKEKNPQQAPPPTTPTTPTTTTAPIVQPQETAEAPMEDAVAPLTEQEKLHEQILADDFKIEDFDLKQLTTLTPDVAKKIIEKANEKTSKSTGLTLPNVKKISTKVATEIIKYRGSTLQLGIEEIDEPVATILVQFKEAWLILDKLKEVDDNTLRILLSHKSNQLAVPRSIQDRMDRLSTQNLSTTRSY